VKKYRVWAFWPWEVNQIAIDVTDAAFQENVCKSAETVAFTTVCIEIIAWEPLSVGWSNFGDVYIIAALNVATGSGLDGGAKR